MVGRGVDVGEAAAVLVNDGGVVVGGAMLVLSGDLFDAVRIPHCCSRSDSKEVPASFKNCRRLMDGFIVSKTRRTYFVCLFYRVLSMKLPVGDVIVQGFINLRLWFCNFALPSFSNHLVSELAVVSV